MKLTLLLLCLVLVGCGGAAGGGTTTPGTVTPPPPPVVVYQTDGLVYSDTTSLGVPGLVLEYYRTTIGDTAYFDVKIHNTSSSNYLYEGWNQILMQVPAGYGDVNIHGVPSGTVNMIIGTGLSFPLNAGSSLNAASTVGYSHVVTVPAAINLTPINFRIYPDPAALPYFTPVGNG